VQRDSLKTERQFDSFFVFRCSLRTEEGPQNFQANAISLGGASGCGGRALRRVFFRTHHVTSSLHPLPFSPASPFHLLVCLACMCACACVPAPCRCVSLNISSARPRSRSSIGIGRSCAPATQPPRLRAPGLRLRAMADDKVVLPSPKQKGEQTSSTPAPVLCLLPVTLLFTCILLGCTFICRHGGDSSSCSSCICAHALLSPCFPRCPNLPHPLSLSCPPTALRPKAHITSSTIPAM